MKDIELGMGAESNVLGEIRADLLLQLNLAKRTEPKSEDRVSVSSNEIRADLQQLDPGQREGADSEDTESVLAFNEQVQRDLDNLSRNCIERFKTKAVELWNRPWWPLPDSIALPLIAFTLMFMATLFADTMNALTKGEPFGKVSWELIKLPYTIGYGIYLLIKNGPSTPPIKLDRYVLPPYSNDTNNITYANCTLASGESIDCDTFNISSLSCIPLTVKLLNCSFPTNITYFLNKTVDRYFYASVESSSGSTEGGGEALQLIDFNGLQRLVLSNFSLVEEIVDAMNESAKGTCFNLNILLAGIYHTIMNARATILYGEQGTLRFYKDGRSEGVPGMENYPVGCRQSSERTLALGVLGELGIKVQDTGQLYIQAAESGEVFKYTADKFLRVFDPTRTHSPTRGALVSASRSLDVSAVQTPPPLSATKSLHAGVSQTASNSLAAGAVSKKIRFLVVLGIQQLEHIVLQ